MFKKIILSITFSIGFIFACSEGDDFDNSQNDSFDRGNLQTNLADNIIIPAYQDLTQQLGLLVSAKENFIANSNQENLEVLRNNFLESYMAADLQDGRRTYCHLRCHSHTLVHLSSTKCP